MHILIPIAGLAVTDPSSGRGELDVPSFQDFDVTHAVLTVQIVSLMSAEQRYDCLLFVLSPNHVGEYFKFLVRVKAKAVMSLDPVLVDNSQTSERFETISEVLSATQPGFQYTNSARFIDTHGGTANVYNA